MIGLGNAVAIFMRYPCNLNRNKAAAEEEEELNDKAKGSTNKNPLSQLQHPVAWSPKS